MMFSSLQPKSTRCISRDRDVGDKLLTHSTCSYLQETPPAHMCLSSTGAPRQTSHWTDFPQCPAEPKAKLVDDHFNHKVQPNLSLMHFWSHTVCLKNNFGHFCENVPSTSRTSRLQKIVPLFTDMTPFCWLNSCLHEVTLLEHTMKSSMKSST